MDPHAYHITGIQYLLNRCIQHTHFHKHAFQNLVIPSASAGRTQEERDNKQDRQHSQVLTLQSTPSLSQPWIMGTCTPGILREVSEPQSGTFPSRSALLSIGLYCCANIWPPTYVLYMNGT